MAEFRTCPVCGASVKLENVERHVAKAHPRAKVDFGLSEAERSAVKERRRTPLLGGRERWLYPLVAVLLVVAVVVGVILAVPPPSDVPETAPPFALESAEGGTVALADFRGSVILLNFMDVHCTHCQQETAEVLVPVHNAYGNRVVFLSVAVGFVGPPDTPEDVRSFKAFYEAAWPFLLDDGTVYPEYGVRGTPTTFVLDRDLGVHDAFEGRVPGPQLTAALDGALGG